MARLAAHRIHSISTSFPIRTLPVFLASYTFPATKIANANGVGQVLFGGANYVFALEANNGIVAFQPVLGPPGPPVFTPNPATCG